MLHVGKNEFKASDCKTWLEAILAVLEEGNVRVLVYLLYCSSRQRLTEKPYYKESFLAMAVLDLGT
jgi:hypothetical protein